MSDRSFNLGRLVITRHALETLTQTDVHKSLQRHARGDWGDCCKEDWQENDRSVGQRLRILSIYHSESGDKFYIETAADRSTTCIMLAADY